MADITMCVGTGCPLRETCYRYTAEPNEYRQSFSDFTNRVKDEPHLPSPFCPELVPNVQIEPTPLAAVGSNVGLGRED